MRAATGDDAVSLERTAAVLGLLAALSLAGPRGAAAQEPADGDTVSARDSAGMRAISDSTLGSQMDSVRRAERQKRNAAIRSLRPGDRIRIQLGRDVLQGDLLNLVDGELVLRTSQSLPPGLGGPDAAADSSSSPDTVGRAVRVPSADTTASVGRSGPIAEDPFPPPDDTLPTRAVRVPVDAMERMWVEVGSSGRGAVVGAITGGALGALGGYLADTASCDRQEGSCIYSGFDAAAVTGLGGALAGAALGALVGRAFPRWRVWFP